MGPATTGTWARDVAGCERPVCLTTAPLRGEHEAYRRASDRHTLAILAGGCYYTAGRDEALLEWHLRMARDLDSLVHNMQLPTHEATGQPLDNAEVARWYLWAPDRAEKLGVTGCFEVHVNMWGGLPTSNPALFGWTRHSRRPKATLPPIF